MPAYEVYYRKDNDGSAPAAVLLELDYEWAGVVEAETLKVMAQRVASMPVEESELLGHRALRTGDVATDGNRFWVLAPLGIWASVEAFTGSSPTTGEQPLDT